MRRRFLNQMRFDMRMRVSHGATMHEINDSPPRIDLVAIVFCAIIGLIVYAGTLARIDFFSSLPFFGRVDASTCERAGWGISRWGNPTRSASPTTLPCRGGIRSAQARPS